MTGRCDKEDEREIREGEQREGRNEEEYRKRKATLTEETTGKKGIKNGGETRARTERGSKERGETRDKGGKRGDEEKRENKGKVPFKPTSKGEDTQQAASKKTPRQQRPVKDVSTKEQTRHFVLYFHFFVLFP